MKYTPFLEAVVFEAVKCAPCKLEGQLIPADVWTLMTCRQHVIATCATHSMRHLLKHELLQCALCEP